MDVPLMVSGLNRLSLQVEIIAEKQSRSFTSRLRNLTVFKDIARQKWLTMTSKKH